MVDLIKEREYAVNRKGGRKGQRKTRRARSFGLTADPCGMAYLVVFRGVGGNQIKRPQTPRKED